MTTLIEVSEATVMRSGRKLFDRFNLKMYAGEHWVIQGANGSGKTALLQLLAGALHPMTGRVNHSFLRETDWEQRYRERREKLHLIPAHSLKSLIGVAEELFYQHRY